MPGKGARGGADMRRAAAVLLLVAVAAIGLRAGGTFSSSENPQILGLSWRVLYWTIAGAEVVLALAGIALLIARLIWGRNSGKPLQRRRRSLWWLLLLPLMVFGLARLLRMRQRVAPPRTAATHAATTAGAVAHHPQGNPWPLLVLFAALAIAAVALTSYRRRWRPASGHCTRTPIRARPSSAATPRWSGAWLTRARRRGWPILPPRCSAGRPPPAWSARPGQARSPGFSGGRGTAAIR